MYIQIDTRQKPKKHNREKEKYFLCQGHQVIKSKLLVGDYAIPSRMDISVDTKQDCAELYSDLITQHDRFKRECKTAQSVGIRLVVLVENKDGIKSPEEILKWKNPQCARYEEARYYARMYGQKEPIPPASNEKLLKIMNTMTRLYGVEFRFCDPCEAGMTVLNLLLEVQNGQ